MLTGERLADLFWGDRPERKARSSFSTALWHLRRSLPNEACLLSDARTVQFDPEFPLWLDVEEVEASAVRDDTSSLQAAVALYRGDFLEDFYDDCFSGGRPDPARPVARESGRDHWLAGARMG